MRICVENGTFTVAFLREGLQKVCTLVLYDTSAKNIAVFTVQGLVGRSTQDFMGGLPRNRCFGRESKCYGRISYCGSPRHPLFPCFHDDLDSDSVCLSIYFPLSILLSFTCIGPIHTHSPFLSARCVSMKHVTKSALT